MKHVITAFATLLLPLVNPPETTNAAPHTAANFTLPTPPPQPSPNPAKYIGQVIAIEGGYQNYPDDGANAGIGTKYGITPRTYQKYKGKLPTARQMKALSKTEAAGIYARIWQDAGMYLLPDAVVADVFDAYVNTPQTALQIIERITATQGCASAFAIDSATARAIGQIPAQVFTQKLKEARRQYYLYRAGKYNKSSWHLFFKRIGKSGSKKNSRYLEGWMKRLNLDSE